MKPGTSLLRRSKPSVVTNINNTTMTPPMATHSRGISRETIEDMEEEDFDEEYFNKTYVPLSNLPTPPLSSHSNASTRQQSPADSKEYLDPQLLGPAVRLTNLIPTSTSLTSPSVPRVHAILTRASLPFETIALAVSILDALNPRFSLQYRKSFPLSTPVLNLRTNQSFRSFSELSQQKEHIDSVHPEIIVLSALILAVKFLDDKQDTTIFYVQDWARGIWNCGQVNYTQWCLLENLGHRLLPLWDQDIIISALEDMERAGRQYEPSLSQKSAWDDGIRFDEIESGEWELERQRERGMSNGKAVRGPGDSLTPVETPLAENVRGVRRFPLQSKTLLPGKDDKNAFGKTAFEEQEFREDVPEPWPVYVDPGMVMEF